MDSGGILVGGIHSQGLGARNSPGRPGDSSPAPRDADVSRLFQPLKLGRTQVQNRLVYAPLTRGRAVGHIPQDNAIEYYTRVARGSEGGLILTEGTAVSEDGIGFVDCPGIYNEAQLQQWKKVTTSVKAQGAAIYCQLWHTGRNSHPSMLPSGTAIVSSSATACATAVYTKDGPQPSPVPTALDKAGIARIVQIFKQAARNAIDVGFDGVEVHGANGYLLDQFIKPKPNQRTDEYGGSVQNRCRFPLEVVQAVVDEIGADRVGIRLSAFQEFGDVADPEPYATNEYLVKELNRFGLAYLHMVEPRVTGAADNEEDYQHQSNEPFRMLFKGTFIAAGGYDCEKSFKALREGHADLIAFGRHYLANPDLPRRIREQAGLNKYDRNTFYAGGDKGYIDYPFLPEALQTAQTAAA